jgi:tRNA (guanine37-N1)-methyltransferase
LKQEKVESLSAEHDWLLLLCGHYEGIDQRIVEGGWIDEEISIGDYVLTGGELPAMVLIDAVARHIPGVLGKAESAHEESFSSALDRKKEYPHYTRPDDYQGHKVPEVLLSGHHAEIEKWRKDQLS